MTGTAGSLSPNLLTRHKAQRRPLPFMGWVKSRVFRRKTTAEQPPLGAQARTIIAGEADVWRC